MTKAKFNKLHPNTLRELAFFAEEEDPVKFISRIQSVTVGLDQYGNPNDDTISYIQKEFRLPADVARHFYYLT